MGSPAEGSRYQHPITGKTVFSLGCCRNCSGSSLGRYDADGPGNGTDHAAERMGSVGWCVGFEVLGCRCLGGHERTGQGWRFSRSVRGVGRVAGGLVVRLDGGAVVVAAVVGCSAEVLCWVVGSALRRVVAGTLVGVVVVVRVGTVVLRRPRLRSWFAREGFGA